MYYLLLGLALLVVGLIAARAFAQANPAVVARQLKTAGGLAAFAGAAVFALRGQLSYALPLAMLGYWVLYGAGPPPWAPGTAKSQGQTSRITTDHLAVELDHDSGEIRGQVLRGIFKGRAIEALKPAELALLWQDCRFVDPQSAEIVETYLDRAHPSWREDMARGEEAMAGGPDGRMSRAEAFDILGLKADASEDDIRRAHRELMLKMHPDRGGSTYLAAKINEAKDVLIG